uniref:Regulator of microtubule dynamics protein 1 n=1 Tax=Candidatus Kentrum eta TaxID=2126337 RepID=A0A450UDM5_9GAMM|nr:MAG: Tetratricopeptide repeat-containing protein [Candidatus Kentron sp. H]VFJ90570.1 MAG: Tetratricopeptide repeat-containing protein [Candidatus Kentron sp. H]VFJ96713.1 MAG: Tetratricopeptide repeat-containing protein [Candidatus Kentron sp. H]
MVVSYILGLPMGSLGKALLIGFLLVLSMATPQAATLDEWIELGDTRKAKWDHRGAADAYQQALGMDPTHYFALWNTADEITELAHALPRGEKERKEALFTLANDLCDRAIAVKPDGWEGHFYKAVALGRLALFQGGKEKIAFAKAIRAEAEKAIELNPDAHRAYHVLGRWHQQMANLNWVLRAFAKVIYGGAPPGSNETSVAMFRRAIEIAPDEIRHHLELARTYRFMGKKALMRAALERAIALPSLREGDEGFKEEAREMREDFDFAAE